MSSGGDIIVSADKYGFVGAGTLAIRNTEFSRAFIEVMRTKHKFSKGTVTVAARNTDFSSSFHRCLPLKVDPKP